MGVEDGYARVKVQELQTRHIRALNLCSPNVLRLMFYGQTINGS